MRGIILDSNGAVPEQISNVLGRNYEIRRVDNLKGVIKDISSKPLPYYSLVIFNVSDLKKIRESTLEQKVSEIREGDPFVPHLLYGPDMSHALISSVARGGYSSVTGITNFYVANNPEDLSKTIDLVFMRPLYLPNTTIIKISGSSFDFDRQTPHYNLDYLCKILVALMKEGLGSSGTTDRKRRIILTTGACPFGDVSKDFFKKYENCGSFYRPFSIQMLRNSYSNLNMLMPHLGEETAFLVPMGFFYYITTESSIGRIPLINMAPHYIMARDGIPLQDSDTHTIALAEFYGTERVVLIKRTDGIYDFDPYRGFILDPIKVGCSDLYGWIENQNGNRRHDVVTVDQMLKGGISREGTGVDGRADGSVGHLMEDSALEYFRKCQHVKEIVLVHIAPEEMHYQIGDNRYKHVVTGEEVVIDPQMGWRGILEKNIRDAFRGIAKSKIVKGD